jgi:hypothetical protein
MSPGAQRAEAASQVFLPGYIRGVMQSSGKGDAHTANLPYHQLASREANERVAALNRRWGTDNFPSSFVCECPDPNCNERFLVSHEEYDRVRLSGTFVMLPGH